MMSPQLSIPWNVDADEERVLRTLVREAYGQANAIPMVDLALDAHLSTRDLQDVIHRLVERHGIAICSSSRRGANGYWLPATPEEVAAGMADLTGRIRHLAARARALDAAAAREFTRQLALEMGAGN
jgi:hypothetical protein